MDELKPDEIRQIVEEIETWYKETAMLASVHVFYLRYFYDLPVEAYEVVLENGAVQHFFRNDEGKLAPAYYRTYVAAGYQPIQE